MGFFFFINCNVKPFVAFYFDNTFRGHRSYGIMHICANRHTHTHTHLTKFGPRNIIIAIENEMKQMSKHEQMSDDDDDE